MQLRRVTASLFVFGLISCRGAAHHPPELRPPDGAYDVRQLTMEDAVGNELFFGVVSERDSITAVEFLESQLSALRLHPCRPCSGAWARERTGASGDAAEVSVYSRAYRSTRRAGIGLVVARQFCGEGPTCTQEVFATVRFARDGATTQLETEIVEEVCQGFVAQQWD